METSRSNSDEIDFLQLLARLTRFLGQNWLIIVLSIGCCLALSWLAYRRAPAVFESKMLVQSKFLTESYAIPVVSSLQMIIASGSDSAVAANLNLTVAEASAVERISLEPALNDKVVIQEEEKVAFSVVAQTTDPRIFPRLQQGIVFFFEKNEFVKLRVSERRKGYQNLIDKIDQEIGSQGNPSSGTETGSLYPQRLTRKNVKEIRYPIPVLFDPSTMAVYMLKERMDVAEKLAVLRGLEVVHGFPAIRSQVKPKFSVYMASGFSTGVIVALLLLGARSLQWLLKKYPA